MRMNQIAFLARGHGARSPRTCAWVNESRMSHKHPLYSHLPLELQQTHCAPSSSYDLLKRGCKKSRVQPITCPSAKLPEADELILPWLPRRMVSNLFSGGGANTTGGKCSSTQHSLCPYTLKVVMRHQLQFLLPTLYYFAKGL